MGRYRVSYHVFYRGTHFISLLKAKFCCCTNSFSDAPPNASQNKERPPVRQPSGSPREGGARGRGERPPSSRGDPQRSRVSLSPAESRPPMPQAKPFLAAYQAGRTRLGQRNGYWGEGKGQRTSGRAPRGKLECGQVMPTDARPEFIFFLGHHAHKSTNNIFAAGLYVIILKCFTNILRKVAALQQRCNTFHLNMMQMQTFYYITFETTPMFSCKLIKLCKN